MTETAKTNPPEDLNARPERPLIAALIRVQQEMGIAIKDATNPHFRASYASLGSCWDACKDALAKYNIAVTNQTVVENGEIILETTLRHVQGETISTALPLLTAQKTMQGLGSALTYARRYNLMALVGICPEDDDGIAAAGQGEGQGQPRQRAAQGKGAASKQPPKNEVRDGLENMRKLVWVLWRKGGYPEEDLRALLKSKFKVESTKDLDWAQLKELIEALKKEEDSGA